MNHVPRFDDASDAIQKNRNIGSPTVPKRGFAEFGGRGWILYGALGGTFFVVSRVTWNRHVRVRDFGKRSYRGRFRCDAPVSVDRGIFERRRT